MMLSIVTTLYKSERYVQEFYARIVKAAASLTPDFEIVFVNDGSPDESVDIACTLADSDPRVSVVDLSRNFGHHRAMMSGLRHARGDLVFLIDVDLEEQPEALGMFWSLMHSDAKIDVAFGQLEQKTVPWIKQYTSNAFYRLFNALSTTPISDREVVSRLMRRPYVDALLSYGEYEIFIPAVWADAGFVQRPVTVTKGFDGFSSYTLSRRVAMAVDAITSFSSRPLLYIFYLGLLFSTSSTLYFIYLLTRKLFLDDVVLGWTSLMAGLFLIGGIIIFSLGVVGIYVAKIYTEVKRRPNAIVRRVHKSAANAASPSTIQIP